MKTKEQMWWYLQSKGWMRLQDTINFCPVILYTDAKYESDQYEDVEVAYKIEKARENEK